MRDPGVKCQVKDLTAILQDIHMTEIMPESQRYGGQLKTALTTSAIFHRLITCGRRRIAHDHQKISCVKITNFIFLSTSFMHTLPSCSGSGISWFSSWSYWRSAVSQPFRF